MLCQKVCSMLGLGLNELPTVLLPYFMLSPYSEQNRLPRLSEILLSSLEDRLPNYYYKNFCILKLILKNYNQKNYNLIDDNSNN